MKTYLCIGGPLDGIYANSADFLPRRVSQGPVWYDEDAPKAGTVLDQGGRHASHARDYFAFNRADRIPTLPTMVWLHASLLP